MNSTFSINWNGHKNNICYGFSSFQQNEEFVDMTLAADGQCIKVHQNIMAVASPYLKNLLKSIPCPHPVIFFNNISHSTLRLILEYVYNGEVQIPLHKVQSFIDAAKSLQMIGIGAAEDTDVGVKKDIELDNVMDFLKPKTNIQKPDMCTNLLQTFLGSDKGNDKTNAIQSYTKENENLKTISGIYRNDESNQNTDTPFFKIVIPTQSIEPQQFDMLKSNETGKQLQSMISIEDIDDVCIEEADQNNLSTNEMIDNCSSLEDFEKMPVNVVHAVNKQKLNQDEFNADSFTEESTDVNDETSILQSETVPCDSDISKDTNNTGAGQRKLNIKSIKIIKPRSPKRSRRCSKKGMEWLISLNNNKKENKEVDDENAQQLCSRNWNKISLSSERSESDDVAESNILKNSDIPKYSISNRGCLQLIVGRYLYYAHHVSGYGLKRRWRCIEYRKLRCPAYLDAFKDVISTRKNDHSHAPHDMKILKKKNDNKLFDNLEDALSNAAQVCEEMNVDLTTDDE